MGSRAQGLVFIGRMPIMYIRPCSGVACASTELSQGGASAGLVVAIQGRAVLSRQAPSNRNSYRQ